MTTTTTDQDNPAHYEVGQALYFEWNEYAYPMSLRLTGEMVTIKQVGRKWLTLSNDRRVNKVTLIADGKGFTPTARCFLSKEERVLAREKQTEWLALHNLVTRFCKEAPNEISLENIKQALALLRS